MKIRMFLVTLLMLGGLSQVSPAQAVSVPGAEVWNMNSGAPLTVNTEKGTVDVWAGLTSNQLGYADVNYVQAKDFECLEQRNYGAKKWKKATTNSGQRLYLRNGVEKEVRSVMKTGVC